MVVKMSLSCGIINFFPSSQDEGLHAGHLVRCGTVSGNGRQLTVAHQLGASAAASAVPA